MKKENNPKNIKFTILSEKQNVELIGLSINKLCSYSGLNEKTCYDIELCTVEAINNCIEHAYRNQSDRKIETNLNLYTNKIVIEVIDSGFFHENFKPVANDFDAKDIEYVPEGGMGLQLIFQIMDKIDYKRVNQTNVLTMEKIFS